MADVTPYCEPTIFGRLYSPDPRDMAYPMKPKRISAVVRLERHWWMTKTLNQGQYPHCVGYSGHSLMAAAPYMDRQGRRVPPPVVCYEMAQDNDEWPGRNYDGSSVRGMMKAFAKAGLIDEYHWAQNITQVRDFILTEGPVQAGTDWFAGMSSPKPVGPKSELYVEPSGESLGGHAYLFSGYSKKRHAFRILNSWGAEWGEKGRAWVSYDVANYLLFQLNGEASSVVERRI